MDNKVLDATHGTLYGCGHGNCTYKQERWSLKKTNVAWKEQVTGEFLYKKQAKQGNMLFRDAETGIKAIFFFKWRNGTSLFESSGSLRGERQEGAIERVHPGDGGRCLCSERECRSTHVLVLHCYRTEVCYKYSLICIKYWIVIFKRMNWNTIISNSKNLYWL